MITKTPEYAAWRSMKKRCFNKNATFYHCYGGRGITVCKRWLEFKNFLSDMGERPQGLSLDRIDNNGNYEPNNCRWASLDEQCRNRRANVFFTFNGETLCKRDWEVKLGLSVGAISHRIESGWDIEKAFTTPATRRYK